MASHLAHMIQRFLSTLLLMVGFFFRYIIIGDDFEYITFFKVRLREQFLMIDLGPLCNFLVIEDSTTSVGLYIS
jgi:hypothetical protein